MPQYPYAISIGSFVDFQTALINNTPPIVEECFKLSSQYDMWLSTLSVLGNSISVNEYSLINNLINTIYVKQGKCDETSTTISSVLKLLGNEKNPTSNSGGFGGPSVPSTPGGFGGPYANPDWKPPTRYPCRSCCDACKAGCIKKHGDMKECCPRGVECWVRQLEEYTLCLRQWREEGKPFGDNRGGKSPPDDHCNKQCQEVYRACKEKYESQGKGYNVDSERDRYRALVACLGGTVPEGVPNIPTIEPFANDNCQRCCCSDWVVKEGCCDKLGYGHATGAPVYKPPLSD